MSKMDFDDSFDDYKALINRYERSEGQTDRYFDVEEIEVLVDYYLRLGDTSKSVEALKVGLKMHPTNNVLQLQKAKIFLAKRQFAKALKIIEESYILDVDTLFMKGEALLNLGRTREALVVFEDLAQHIDEGAELFVDIASLLNSLQHYKAASHFLKKGVELYPDNSDLLRELAFAYEQQDLPWQALNIYNHLLDLNPYDATVWFYVGLIYFNEENYNKALEAFDFAVTINDADYLSWLQKAHCHFYNNEYNEAKSAYRIYLDNNPLDGKVWSFYAECFESTDDSETALSYFLKSSELDSSYVDAWIGAGVCSLNLQQPAQALIYLNKALKLNSDSAEIWTYIGDSYRDMDDYEKALSAYLVVIKIDPQDGEVWKEIGDIYLQTFLFEEAVYYYEEAFRLEPLQENLPLFLAMCYYKLGNINSMAHYMALAEQRTDMARQVFLDVFPEAASVLKQLSNN